jgi:hypothetical protein
MRHARTTWKGALATGAWARTAALWEVKFLLSCATHLIEQRLT